MKNRIENALKAILENNTLKALWTYSLQQGGAENIIQTCLAQELNDESKSNIYIEFDKVDIAIFDEGINSPPTNIIEIGSNYLSQDKEAKLKPLQDIFKRIADNRQGKSYKPDCVYSLMFIAEKIVGCEGSFPRNGKTYINKEVNHPEQTLQVIRDYWISYVESPYKVELINIGCINTTANTFSQLDYLKGIIKVNDLPSHKLGNHILHSFLIQIT